MKQFLVEDTLFCLFPLVHFCRIKLVSSMKSGKVKDTETINVKAVRNLECKVLVFLIFLQVMYAAAQLSYYEGVFFFSFFFFWVHQQSGTVRQFLPGSSLKSALSQIQFDQDERRQDLVSNYSDRKIIHHSILIFIIVGFYFILF